MHLPVRMIMEERNFDDVEIPNNPFTAGVVERRSSLSNSVKTIPSLILIRN
jgi:hypothetical protein